jgi:NDP-sugar pyrophosphorylase family protein
LSEPFLVMNGDLLTTIDYSDMLKFHRDHKKIATIGIAKKTVKIDLGVIELGAGGELQNYIEKPVLNHLVSMGIYVFSPEVLEYVRGAGRIDLPDLILKLSRAGKPVMAYQRDYKWLDIGRPDDYAAATEIFMAERALFLKTSGSEAKK